MVKEVTKTMYTCDLCGNTGENIDCFSTDVTIPVFYKDELDIDYCTDITKDLCCNCSNKLYNFLKDLIPNYTEEI